MIKISNFLLIFILTTVISFAQNYKIIEDISLLVATEDFLEVPKISPDGNYVAFGNSHNVGIYLINYSGGEIKRISEEYSASWNMKWSPKSDEILTRVNFWDENFRTHESAIMLYNIDGSSENLSGNLKDVSFPFWSNSGNSISWYDAENKLNIKNFSEEIAEFQIYNNKRVYNLISGVENLTYETNGMIINVVWSPDNKKVVIELLGSGLYVKNLESGELFDLGYGEYPAWISNEHFIFMKVEDDGHDINKGNIFVCKYDGDKMMNLTENRDEIFLYPSANTEGKIVFQCSEGKIYKMKIEIE